MTKTRGFTFGVCGNDVADVYLVICNYDAVDKQLDELTTLGKRQGVQGGLNTLAEVLDANCERCQIRSVSGLEPLADGAVVLNRYGFGSIHGVCVQTRLG